MMDFNVLPECYVDTKLLKILVPPHTKHGYNHQKGVSVIEKVMKTKLADEFALGVIDRDKREVGYLDEFNSVFCYRKTNGAPQIELFKHTQKHHYIIVHTNMEEWILDCANENNIDLADFELPNNLKALIKITKTSTSENADIYSENLKNLFKVLVSAKSMLLLQYWVQSLKNENYQIDMAILIAASEAIIK
jgi:hypothetical protein